MAVLDGAAGAERFVTDGIGTPGRPLDSDVEPAGPLTRAGVARVGAATAVTALCGYAVLYLAARDLAPAGFSVFGVFWGAFGLVTGAANGLLQEATREVRTALNPAIQPPVSVTVGGSPAVPAHTRPMQVAALVGVSAAAFIAGTSPLWSKPVFVESRVLSTVLLSVGLAGFCLHATLLGMLAGSGRWTQYGSLMVTDAALRVAVAAAAFVLGWGLVGYLWATVGGALAWLIVLVASAKTRAAARLRTPVSTAAFLRGTFHSVAAAGASAILVMGFPVLLKATSGELGATGGVVILAVTLTRAPLLVPLTAMQGNLIAHFVDQRSRRLRALLGPGGVVVGIGAVGVVAAGVLGPWLLQAAFGAEYRADGGLLAWLTTAAIAIALLTLTGAATVAAALHRAYSAGWVGATIASMLLLLLPTDLQTRTVIALLCGPLAGMVVHLVALARVNS
jgi:O-antigen/teichoic acid export membrane protein